MITALESNNAKKTAIEAEDIAMRLKSSQVLHAQFDFSTTLGENSRPVIILFSC